MRSEKKNRGKYIPYETGKKRKYNQRESGKTASYNSINFPMLPLKLAKICFAFLACQELNETN